MIMYDTTLKNYNQKKKKNHMDQLILTQNLHAW